MATKNYYVGPQDGWVQIHAPAVSPDSFHEIRITAYPHTHPFFVYGDASTAPTSADTGILVCHKKFNLRNSNGAGNVDGIWVRVKNPVPNSNNMDGKLRLDVYLDGGALA